MIKIEKLLAKKKLNGIKSLDEKAIFYVFGKIIRECYGQRGAENIRPDFYKEGKIFIKFQNSGWANEIWMNESEIVKKINGEIGREEIVGIKIRSN